MNNFYYYYDLPIIHQEIIELLTKIFREEGTMTSDFYYSPTKGGGLTLDIAHKQFQHLQDRPVESLEKLGFGEIEYTSSERFRDYKDKGHFTISKSTLDYSTYKKSSSMNKLKVRIIHKIKDNEIPISIFISICALLISLIPFFVQQISEGK